MSSIGLGDLKIAAVGAKNRARSECRGVFQQPQAFSETHLQDRESLCVRAGAKRLLAALDLLR